MKVGDKVFAKADDRAHVGTVEIVRPSKTAKDVLVAYVRWHKGYATWHCVFDLVLL